MSISVATPSDDQSHQLPGVMDTIVKEVLALPDADGRSRRQLAGEQLEALRKSVYELAMSGVIAAESNAGCEPSIRLDSGAYTTTRYQSRSYRIHVQRAFQGLISLGYLRRTSRGFHNPETGQGTLTRYVATSKLLELIKQAVSDLNKLVVDPSYSQIGEVIRIRMTTGTRRYKGRLIKIKELIDYEDTEETQAMREVVNAINEFLLEHWVDLELSDEEWKILPTDLTDRQGSRRDLDLTSRQLYRVFNSPDLSKGGRLYGGWWQQIPARYRSRITIDGQPTVELDYSSLHPAMLYALEGIKLPADPYSTALGREHRDITKRVFNALINAETSLNGPPRGLDLAAYGLKWDHVKNAVVESFAPLSKYFQTGVGLELQRKDSDMALRIMTDLMRRGIVVLPVHDSFLVQQRHEDDLWRTMGLVFLGEQKRWPRVRPQTKALTSLGPRHGEWIGDFSSANPAVRRLNAHMKLKARQGKVVAPISDAAE